LREKKKFKLRKKTQRKKKRRIKHLPGVRKGGEDSTSGLRKKGKKKNPGGREKA